MSVSDNLLLRRLLRIVTKRKKKVQKCETWKVEAEEGSITDSDVSGYSSCSGIEYHVGEKGRTIRDYSRGLEYGKFWWQDGYCCWSEEQFKRNIRLKKETFDLILEELRPSIEKQSIKQNIENISSDRVLALTIYRLAHGCSFITLQSLFGVSATHADVMFTQVCRIMTRELFDKYVRIPETADEWTNELHGFIENYEFPCIGAWEGFEVYFDTKLKTLSGFRRHCVINILGLVGYNKRFLNVIFGKSDSDQDAMFQRNSAFFEKAEIGEAISSYPSSFDDYGQVPLLTLHDTMFPKFSWLSKGHREESDTFQRQYFNQKLYGAKSVTADAYGILKGRWRILYNKTDCRFKNLKTIVTCCLILHNLCIELGDTCDERWKLEDQKISFLPRRTASIRSCNKVAKWL